ncbi:DNA damage-binding protein 1a [Stylosanthes scabra]|uniref:DNA damage-binding protein 1a n=1 Tax=Stylosanthes scabra TaxID=79078 RepID=A0ABU6RF37_9FABA|nr:DNA damage-binding protein 1a [Stylosanthes scabra]
MWTARSSLFVTSSSVRLVSSTTRELRKEWHALSGYSINVRIPRSVCLCAFEGISYLLCALGDGHLLNFLLNTSTGELTDRKKVSLGTQPITLRTFSSKNTTHVFAASDRPTVIYYSSNKKLLYSNVNLKEVSHMCLFNSAAFPDRYLGLCLAIDKEAELTIGTIDDIQKLHIHSIPLEEPETHFLRLLNDQSFEFISTYPLDTYEYDCFIISCSFSDDSNIYYCVGTAYVLPEENELSKGRILAFAVEDGKLQLILLRRRQKELMKKPEGAIEERARDYNANWMSAVEILDDDIYLGAENSFNLFTKQIKMFGFSDSNLTFLV